MSHLVAYDEAKGHRAKGLAALDVVQHKNSKAAAWQWAAVAAEHAEALGIEKARELLGNGRYPEVDRLREALLYVDQGSQIYEPARQPLGEIVVLGCPECFKSFLFVGSDPVDREEAAICPNCNHFEPEYGSYKIQQKIRIYQSEPFIVMEGREENDELVLIRKKDLREARMTIASLGQIIPIDEVNLLNREKDEE